MGWTPHTNTSHFVSHVIIDTLGRLTAFLLLVNYRYSVLVFFLSVFVFSNNLITKRDSLNRETCSARQLTLLLEKEVSKKIHHT